MRQKTFIRWRHIAIGMAIVLQASAGGSADISTKTLQGLTTVRVVVERSTPNVEIGGLPQTQIQAEVESRLRHAGIPVSDSAVESLYVNLTTRKSREGFYIYSVLVMVQQPAVLLRNPHIVATHATTWWRGTQGIVTEDTLNLLRGHIGDLVEMFITSYREQNPTT